MSLLLSYPTTNVWSLSEQKKIPKPNDLNSVVPYSLKEKFGMALEDWDLKPNLDERTTLIFEMSAKYKEGGQPSVMIALPDNYTCHNFSNKLTLTALSPRPICWPFLPREIEDALSDPFFDPLDDSIRCWAGNNWYNMLEIVRYEWGTTWQALEIRMLKNNRLVILINGYGDIIKPFIYQFANLEGLLDGGHIPDNFKFFLRDLYPYQSQILKKSSDENENKDSVKDTGKTAVGISEETAKIDVDNAMHGETTNNPTVAEKLEDIIDLVETSDDDELFDLTK